MYRTMLKADTVTATKPCWGVPLMQIQFVKGILCANTWWCVFAPQNLYERQRKEKLTSDSIGLTHVKPVGGYMRG